MASVPSALEKLNSATSLCICLGWWFAPWPYFSDKTLKVVDFQSIWLFVVVVKTEVMASKLFTC